MAKRRVSPNRMELMRLKNELQTARRGHRLLKDKRDGLMQKFLELLDETLAKRQEVDELLQGAADSMAMAAALMEPEEILQTMQLSTEALEVEASTQSVMSVQVPVFTSENVSSAFLPDETAADQAWVGNSTGVGAEAADVVPAHSASLAYGFVRTTGDVDIAFDSLTLALKPMLELASLEKTLQILAAELESTRRRVNSLEHVMIPELVESIREIRMKMDENERDNLTRLMKVKAMIVEEEIKARRAKDELISSD